jgi:hypothetical protein
MQTARPTTQQVRPSQNEQTHSLRTPTPVPATFTMRLTETRATIRNSCATTVFTQFGLIKSDGILSYLQPITGGRHSSVGRKTRYILECPGFETLYRWRGGSRFLGPIHGPLNLLHKGYRVSISGTKRPRRGANYLPPPSVGVDNGYSHTTTFPLCLLDM